MRKQRLLKKPYALEVNGGTMRW